MTSDRGAQFTSCLWSAMCNLLGTELHPTTAYHPQANGLVERSHPDLKAALKCQLSGPNWIEELPWVLLGIGTAPKEDLGSSTAELVYGSPLTVPGDFVPDSQPRTASQELQQQCQRVGDLRPVPTTAHGKEQIQTNVPQSLKQAKFVFLDGTLEKVHSKHPTIAPLRLLSNQQSISPSGLVLNWTTSQLTA